MTTKSILKFKELDSEELQKKLLSASQNPAKLGIDAAKILLNTAAATLGAAMFHYNALLEAARDQIANGGGQRLWLPIEVAKKNGEPIWAVLRPDLGSPGSSSKVGIAGGALQWAGVQLPLYYRGGSDVSATDSPLWTANIPNRSLQIPEGWIYGWVPIPASPTAVLLETMDE